MTYLLAFAPLIAGWALLHRASTRPGWGFVGTPPSPPLVLLRKFTRDLDRINRLVVDALAPPMARLGRALAEITEALKA